VHWGACCFHELTSGHQRGLSSVARAKGKASAAPVPGQRPLIFQPPDQPALRNRIGMAAVLILYVCMGWLSFNSVEGDALGLLLRAVGGTALAGAVVSRRTLGRELAIVYKATMAALRTNTSNLMFTTVPPVDVEPEKPSHVQFSVTLDAWTNRAMAAGGGGRLWRCCVCPGQRDRRWRCCRDSLWGALDAVAGGGSGWHRCARCGCKAAHPPSPPPPLDRAIPRAQVKTPGAKAPPGQAQDLRRLAPVKFSRPGYTNGPIFAVGWSRSRGGS
jgi:hypothetical protein